MFAFLAARRRARAQKEGKEITVEQLNVEQEKKEKAAEAKEFLREETKKVVGGCSVVFACSIIMFIISIIILIPALAYGNRVFFLGFGGFGVAGIGLLLIGCIFNDCCTKEDQKEEEEYDVESGRRTPSLRPVSASCLPEDEVSRTSLKNCDSTTKVTTVNRMTDSGISLTNGVESVDDVPSHIPVRLGSASSAPQLEIKVYHNLPTVSM